MMEIGYLPRRKPLADCQPGELIRLSLPEGPIMALVIELGDGYCALGVLGGPAAEKAPYRDTWPTPHTECLSWGTDWFLEPIIGPETYVDNMQFADRSGTLLIFEQSVAMWFARNPHDSRSTSLLISFPSMERLSSERHRGVPVATWKIWTSREERDADRLPIFEFPVDDN